MKKKLFVLGAIVISFLSVSTVSAQDIPGGGADPNSVLQQSPYSFKRNNGNDLCGSEAEIRVSFSTLPDYLPMIAQIRAEQRDVRGVVVNNIDASQFKKKGYVSYCVSSGDVLPAVKLWIRFHYEKSNQDFWVTESLNPTGK